MTLSEDRLRRGLHQLGDEAPVTLEHSRSLESNGKTHRPQAQRARRVLLPALCAAAVLALVIAVPLGVRWFDAAEPDGVTPSQSNPDLRLMLAEPVVFTDVEFQEFQGPLTRDPETGCVLLDGVALLAPVGSSVVDETHVDLVGLGVVELGETIVGRARESSVVRTGELAREQLADQFLVCMGNADRLTVIEFVA